MSLLIRAPFGFRLVSSQVLEADADNYVAVTGLSRFSRVKIACVCQLAGNDALKAWARVAGGTYREIASGPATGAGDRTVGLVAEIFNFNKAAPKIITNAQQISTAVIDASDAINVLTSTDTDNIEQYLNTFSEIWDDVLVGTAGAEQIEGSTADARGLLLVYGAR